MLRRIAAAMLVLMPLAAIAQPSAECRACHDGVKALKMENGHPVEIDYAKVQQGAPEDYKAHPPAEYLTAGRVECGSCHLGHDVRVTRPHRLRADVITLCTSCHVME